MTWAAWLGPAVTGRVLLLCQFSFADFISGISTTNLTDWNTSVHVHSSVLRESTRDFGNCISRFACHPFYSPKSTQTSKTRSLSPQSKPGVLGFTAPAEGVNLLAGAPPPPAPPPNNPESISPNGLAGCVRGGGIAK